MSTVTIYQLNENDGLAHQRGMIIGNAESGTAQLVENHDLRAVLDETEESLFFFKNPDTADTRYSYPLFRNPVFRHLTADEGLSICRQLSVDIAEDKVPIDVVRARIWLTKRHRIQLEFALRNVNDQDRFRSYMLANFNLPVVRFISPLGPVYTASLQANLIAAQ